MEFLSHNKLAKTIFISMKSIVIFVIYIFIKNIIQFRNSHYFVTETMLCNRQISFKFFNIPYKL